MIEKLANQIKKRKLEVPSVFFLEMHKPLAGVASQGMIAFSPFLAPFMGMNNVHDYSRLVGKHGSVEKLIQKLEEIKEEDENDSSHEESTH